MSEIDVNKYKSEWIDQGAPVNVISKSEILSFMHASSKSIGVLFKKNLIIDIFLKFILTISHCGLLILYMGQPKSVWVIAICIGTLLLGMVYQIRMYQQAPNGQYGDQSIKDILESYIGYFHQKYAHSIVLSSLSSPLLLICGFLYYFYMKYGILRVLDVVDLLVLGSLTFLSFIINLTFQLRHFNMHIHQLEDSLNEIEQEARNEGIISHYKKIKKSNTLIYIAILLLGLLLLILIIPGVYY